VIDRCALLLVMAALLAGCADDSGKTATEKTVAPSQSADTSHQDERSQERMTFGPISFVPLKGWEPRETQEGLAFFAPDKPEWKTIGFRPNLGVRRRAHPGVSLEQFRKQLDGILAQSAEEVNRTISQFAKASGEGDGKSVVLKKRGKYILVLRTIDGRQVLSTTFSGVFKLANGLVATETHGMQYIGSDALYTIGLTFPRSAASEMEAVWKTFVEDVRFGPSNQ
jgi:hypothetical protein